MKLSEVKKSEAGLSNDTIDAKGKITYLEPGRKGEEGCPFWDDAKNKIAKLDKAKGQIRIPKAFITDLAKKFKIPVHETYSIPLCVNEGKVCSFFNGCIGEEIACNYGKTEQATPAPQQEKTEDTNLGATSTPAPAAAPTTTPAQSNPTPTAVSGVRG